VRESNNNERAFKSAKGGKVHAITERTSLELLLFMAAMSESGNKSWWRAIMSRLSAANAATTGSGALGRADGPDSLATPLS